MAERRDIRERVVRTPTTNTASGRLIWAPVKSVWFAANALVGTVGAVMTFSWTNLAVFVLLSAVTLCGGHSLGMHRKWIHESYDCPVWLERFGVFLACLVGLGGPASMMRAHDIRDWAQRQAVCHPFYSQHAPIWLDYLRQMNCRIHPGDEPEIRLPPKYTDDAWMRALQHFSMGTNLLLACVLIAVGGWGMAIWGVATRVFVSMSGHALVGWFAHNRGHQDFIKPSAAIQGHNVRFCGLISFGEAYHNNHHAYPECADYGHQAGQWDPGYWVLLQLERLGLVWNIQSVPETHAGDEEPVPA